MPLRNRPLAALVGAFLLLSLGREAVPGFSCPHHVPERDGQAAHAEHGTAEGAPASDHSGDACGCLGHCLGGSAPVLARSTAPLAFAVGVFRGFDAPAPVDRIAAAHPPHFLPFANAPPYGS